MARGNTKGNRTNSPIIGDGGVNATTEELRALSRYALNIFKQDKPDLHNPKEVEQAIINYFINCEENGVRPANLGLYASLGLTKQDVDDVLRGKNKSKVNPACVDLLKRAKIALSSYREGLALSGRLNPATAIFWAKNYDHMSDVTTIEVTSDRQEAPQLTQDEIAKRIPVYSDAEQDDA